MISQPLQSFQYYMGIGFGPAIHSEYTWFWAPYHEFKKNDGQIIKLEPLVVLVVNEVQMSIISCLSNLVLYIILYIFHVNVHN